MKKVFVIILNWNGIKDTLDCLKSAKSLNTENFDLKILVVDNASTDDSLERLKEIPDIETISNKNNMGFAGGNNVGIKYVLKNGADYVVILNNDTVLEKNSLSILIKTASDNPKAGTLSPKIYFEKGYEFHKNKYKPADKGKVIWYAGGVIDWKNIYGSGRGVDEVDLGLFNKTTETDFATGTCMLLTRTALEKVGMFDEKYFMYYEDTDLSQRMKTNGFEVIYVPNAQIWHKVAQSSGIGSNLNDYFITRNRMLFGLKYALFRTKMALVKESLKFLLTGRKWQKIGIRDYYLGRFGKGSWV
jgi:GT2 family glycosyltransferase